VEKYFGCVLAELQKFRLKKSRVGPGKTSFIARRAEERASQTQLSSLANVESTNSWL
jgi:hypothetical protein